MKICNWMARLFGCDCDCGPQVVAELKDIAKAIREIAGETVLTAAEAETLIARAQITLQRLKEISSEPKAGRG